ncbi:MAG TPA: DNA ligase D [Mesorhizobium sp.]|jgi:bifunctional non-homologous end joining protein LigD|nr:DNA ligase D [Mesorhizobium sp.]
MSNTVQTEARTRAPSLKGKAGALSTYRAKRDFTKSPEPSGKVSRARSRRFAVQRHDARRLHFDLRLELGGVLKSWAVTRGPSLDPADKRLAVHTEDHPLEYLTWEGVIPAGEYGGGTMIVWDQGTWTPEGDPEAGLAKGHLEFTLSGERLHGRWHLIRMRGKPREKRENWLLVKGHDEHAIDKCGMQPVDTEFASVISGRTNDELARAGEIRVDHAARRKVVSARKQAPAKLRIIGAKKALLPVFLEPSLATLSEHAPVGPEWLHEIKWDGYRLQARIDGGKVKLLTRRGLDWTAKFKTIADALKELGLGSALIDGEVVVEDQAGIASFSALQDALSRGASERMVFYAFDLLYLEGSSLEATPLIERKTRLATLLEDVGHEGPIRFSEHVEGDGETMVRHACRLGLEGIVSKRKDLPYRAGRGNHWLKTKCTDRQELVIAGFTPSSTSKGAIGSLILGVHENGALRHVGRSGTGFSQSAAKELWKTLTKIERPTAPFAKKLPSLATRSARWVKPELVAEVEIRGWTADGQVRHAAFKGLREDKDPTEVVRENRGASPSAAKPTRTKAAKKASPISAPTFDQTHPDRVLWPDIGLTKQGLADFYAEIADHMLPHIVGRPLALIRCPGGTGGQCFVQKHAWAGMDRSIARHEVDGEQLLTIENLDGLIGLVQAGTLEIHPWGSKLRTLETPDRLVFDLDPDEGVAWQAVVEGALEVRERLRERRLESLVKTSGGKGLHVMVPITPKAGWAEAKAFTRSLVEQMAADSPSRYTATLAKRARKGRIFIDYLRNGRGATAVAAYSTRARPGAPVSAPIGWDELQAGVRPGQFTAENLPARLRYLRAALWADLDGLRQWLPRAH